MKLEEVVKYIRQGKEIRRPNGGCIIFNPKLEIFEETFILTKEDLFSDDWKVEGLE